MIDTELASYGYFCSLRMAYSLMDLGAVYSLR
jgi:hypothetical protein